jgi:hypothetical protein
MHGICNETFADLNAMVAFRKLQLELPLTADRADELTIHADSQSLVNVADFDPRREPDQPTSRQAQPASERDRRTDRPIVRQPLGGQTVCRHPLE